MFKNIFKNKFFKYSLIFLFASILIIFGFYFYKNHYTYNNQTEYVLKKIDSRPDEIKGEIVTLKRLRPEYFKSYHEMSFPEIVRKPLYFPKNASFEWTKNYLEEKLQKEAAKQVLLYMIFDNKDNKLIGSISIREKNPKDPGQFSCWINNNYWGGGRIQEATQLIVDEYFKLTNADSFDAHVEMWNLRSYYALKKAGFKLIKTFYPAGQPPRYILEFYNKNKKNFAGPKNTNKINNFNKNMIKNPGESMNKKVLFILMPKNFRDEEFSVPYNLLKNKYTVHVAGFTKDIATGVNGYEQKPDLILNDLKNSDFDTYDALVIPGGPGSVEYLWDNKKIQDIIKHFNKNKKLVATICYAVIAQIETETLKNKKATVFPSKEAKDILQKHNVEFVDQGVVILSEEKIITSQGPKFTKEFGQAIIDILEK
ncbi:MAG: GNAT family N-acetyltransferase [Candidatus Babeliales bacterium]